MELFKSDKGGKANPNAQPAGPNQPAALSGLVAGKDQRQADHGVDPAKELNSISRKMRINEERVVALRKKLQVIEHNMLAYQKKFLSEIKFINTEISDMKRDFDDLKQKLLGFGRELQESAKREDFQVLEKYINMWEPVNFVTRKEVEKIIDGKLNDS